MMRSQMPWPNVAEAPSFEHHESSFHRLLELLIDRKRSAVLSFRCANNRRGAIYLREGHIIDAEYGQLSGEVAFHELLSEPGERFQMELKPDRLNHRVVITEPSHELMRRSARRQACWSLWAARLPPLDSVLIVDFTMLETLDDVDELAPVVRLFDGRRTLLDVIDDSELLRLDTLQLLLHLHEAGVLEPPGFLQNPEFDGDEIDTWLRMQKRPSWLTMSVAALLMGFTLGLVGARVHHAHVHAAPAMKSMPAATATSPVDAPNAVLEALR